jgi:hypothetical protein
MKTFALVAALSLGSMFIPQYAFAGCSFTACAVDQPDTPSLPRPQKAVVAQAAFSPRQRLSGWPVVALVTAPSISLIRLRCRPHRKAVLV